MDWWIVINRGYLKPSTEDQKIGCKIPLLKQSYKNLSISTQLSRANHDSSSKKGTNKKFFLVRFSINQYSFHPKEIGRARPHMLGNKRIHYNTLHHIQSCILSYGNFPKLSNVFIFDMKLSCKKIDNYSSDILIVCTRLKSIIFGAPVRLLTLIQFGKVSLNLICRKKMQL